MCCIEDTISIGGGDDGTYHRDRGNIHFSNANPDTIRTMVMCRV